MPAGLTRTIRCSSSNSTSSVRGSRRRVSAARGARHGQDEAVARFDPVPRLVYHPLAQPQAALAHQRLQARARHLRQPAGQEPVEPLAVVRGLGRELDRAGAGPAEGDHVRFPAARGQAVRRGGRRADHRRHCYADRADGQARHPGGRAGRSGRRRGATVALPPGGEVTQASVAGRELVLLGRAPQGQFVLVVALAGGERRRLRLAGAGRAVSATGHEVAIDGAGRRRRRHRHGRRPARVRARRPAGRALAGRDSPAAGDRAAPLELPASPWPAPSRPAAISAAAAAAGCSTCRRRLCRLQASADRGRAGAPGPADDLGRRGADRPARQPPPAAAGGQRAAEPGCCWACASARVTTIVPLEMCTVADPALVALLAAAGRGAGRLADGALAGRGQPHPDRCRPRPAARTRPAAAARRSARPLAALADGAGPRPHRLAVARAHRRRR